MKRNSYLSSLLLVAGAGVVLASAALTPGCSALSSFTETGRNTAAITKTVREKLDQVTAALENQPDVPPGESKPWYSHLWNLIWLVAVPLVVKYRRDILNAVAAVKSTVDNVHEKINGTGNGTGIGKEKLDDS